jgi:hypothetical protein
MTGPGKSATRSAPPEAPDGADTALPGGEAVPLADLRDIAPPGGPQRRDGLPLARVAPGTARPTAPGRPGVDFSVAVRCSSSDAHGATAAYDPQATHELASTKGRAPWGRELVKRTIELWQPYYDEPLTDETAREILENAVGFFRVVLSDRGSQKRQGPPPERHFNNVAG